MAASGYEAVYLGDVQFRLLPRETLPASEALVFSDDDAHIVFRPEEEIRAIRGVVEEAGLGIESLHFTQTLPPPGYPLSWLYERHARFVHTASVLGVRRFTTHIGWMYGIANVEIMGEEAERFRRGEIDQKRLNESAREAYGGLSRMRSDSLEVYRNLSGLAADHGITVTIETACSEYYEMNLSPRKIIAFFREVGAENLGICVDSGHCHLNGLDPGAVIKECGRWFVETHFHDNFGNGDRHNPIGLGTVDWRSVILAMIEVGYDGLVTFEQEDYHANAMAWQALLRVMEKEM